MISFVHQLSDMQQLNSTYSQRLDYEKSRYFKPIKVAIIDDGFEASDPAFHKDTGCYYNGRSFNMADGPYKSSRPFIYSNSGHGTVMAKLIRTMCPWAHLFIARLDCGLSGGKKSGTLQPTVESAVKV